MIYQRRAIQRRLDELREVFGCDDVNKLVARLNRPGKDRIAAMWELVVFHGLSKCGQLKTEVPLDSGRRPDIFLEQEALRITADITAVSDESLDKENPYNELGQLIEAAKKKLGLPIGGVHIRIGSRHENTKRGPRTVLLLPPREKLQEFVRQTVLPQLRDQIREGKAQLHVEVQDGNIGLDITIDPDKSPYSSVSYAAYDLPKIKDRNPLFNALKAKTEQLRGAEGFTGIIVGDGGCVALSASTVSGGAVSAEHIVEEFFRQYSSVDFVLLLSVRERRQHWMTVSAPDRQNYVRVFFNEKCEVRTELNELFETMVQHFPKPAMMPVNGALRAREDGYSLGHHGGYSMSGSSTVRVSLREFTEIFAGLRTLQDNGAKNVDAARKLNQKPSHVNQLVLSNLSAGRLPISIEIIRTDEDDNDDWVEIRFGDTDPSIAPLR